MGNAWAARHKFVCASRYYSILSSTKREKNRTISSCTVVGWQRSEEKTKSELYDCSSIELDPRHDALEDVSHVGHQTTKVMSSVFTELPVKRFQQFPCLHFARNQCSSCHWRIHARRSIKMEFVRYNLGVKTCLGFLPSPCLHEVTLDSSFATGWNFEEHIVCWPTPDQGTVLNCLFGYSFRSTVSEKRNPG